MKCSLCGIESDGFTTVKKVISSDCKGVKKWQLELCDDCRLDFLMQLIPQMILELDVQSRSKV